MFEIHQTPEEQIRNEELRFDEQLRYARTLIFCPHCSKQYNRTELNHEGASRCKNASCPVGEHNIDGDIVRRMPLERKLALAKTLPNVQIESRKFGAGKEGKFEVQMRNRKHQIYGVLNETGLDSLVEGVLQIGIWGTDPVWQKKDNGDYEKIVRYEKRKVDSFYFYRFWCS